MPDLSISIDSKAVDRILSELPDKYARPALSRALNKTAANVRTAASRAIREKRGLSTKAVNDALTVRRSTPRTLLAQLRVTGKPIPLKEYKARAGKRGVTVAVTKGARKRVVVGGIKAFISEQIGGHVFVRTGKPRLPIKKLFGPSIPSTFLNAEVRKAWEATAQDSLLKRTAEEVRYELMKIEKKRAG